MPETDGVGERHAAKPARPLDTGEEPLPFGLDAVVGPLERAPCAVQDLRRADTRRLGAILLATVVLAWGLTWPVNKLILASVPPVWAVALRTGIGAVALFVLAAAQRRLALPPRQDLPVLVSIAPTNSARLPSRS